jgi:hypothetical protein
VACVRVVNNKQFNRQDVKYTVDTWLELVYVHVGQICRGISDVLVVVSILSPVR